MEGGIAHAWISHLAARPSVAISGASNSIAKGELHPPLVQAASGRRRTSRHWMMPRRAVALIMSDGSRRCGVGLTPTVNLVSHGMQQASTC
jgi:hypothetical protein